jgi:hypothetical protein
MPVEDIEQEKDAQSRKDLSEERSEVRNGRLLRATAEQDYGSFI